MFLHLILSGFTFCLHIPTRVGVESPLSRFHSRFSKTPTTSAGMIGDAQLASQTLSFGDAVTPSLDTRGIPMDHTRDTGFLSDATLSEFFERPIKIKELSWGVEQTLDSKFDPWDLYWSNAEVLARISNYHLLKCNLHVKFVLNGNAFYYGRLIASYLPFDSVDQSYFNRAPVRADFVGLSQKMHVYMNPTLCQGGDLQLPFFYDSNALQIPYKEWTQMGQIRVGAINPLKHANGGTEPVSLSIFAWATNVSYAIPTRNRPEAGDEYSSNIISKPASTIARYAGSLATLPWIGPFARATEIGATAVASISKIFGYAAPIDLASSLLVPRARNSLATTDDKYMGLKLTVDSKQELTLDPATTGINTPDELTICGIAQKESYLTTFDWAVSAAAEQLLFNSYVDPGIHQIHGPVNEHHLTAAAFAVLPFKYWRGTMRFRFQIVASEYHKGRIRIVYDPNTGGATSAYNTHYNKVHDISVAKDFSFDVGWAQSTPYKQSFGINNTPLTDMFGSAALLLKRQDIGNGVLSVYVLNKLTTASTVVSDIQVNVFVSMLDDFEVAEPSERLSDVRFTPVPIEGRNQPEALDNADEVENPVTDPAPIGSMADTGIVDKDVTKLFFGEVIASFRQLLKRNYFHERILIPVVDTLAIVQVSRGAFPGYGGYTDTPPPPGSPIIDLNNGSYYYYAQTTLLNYLSKAYVGRRGSLRWLLDFSRCHASTVASGYLGGSTSVIFGRDDDYFITTTTYPHEAANLPGDFLAANLNLQRGFTPRGASITNNAVNPLSAVEIPYYAPKRFSPTRKNETFTANNQEPGWKFQFTTFPVEDPTDSYVDTYVSAGEDFNLFYFNGLPIVYYQSIAPDPLPPP